MDEVSLPISNDDLLLRTVDTGDAKDIIDLLTFCNLEITSFSNDVLNRSVIQACYRGHSVLVQFLLQDNARLEVKDDNGNTPLLICSMAGMSDIVKILLTKGADVNSTNNNGDASLHLANSREVIHILLCHDGIELNHRNVNGYTALMSAIEAMNLIKVKQLILAGSCPESQVNPQDIAQLTNTLGENALQIAQRKGVGAIAELLHRSYLLEQHPIFFSVVYGNLDHCNTLLRCVLFDNSEIMSIKPNILCVVLNFIKINRISLSKTELELVTRLCQTGVNVNKCSDCDKSPLDIVMDIGNYDLAEILCNYGVIIPHQAIINLVVKDYINFIPLFAVHGGVMNQLDENGVFVHPGSALDVALQNSQIGCANVLLYHGAKLDVNYALNQAVDSSNVKILEFLLDECKEETHLILHNNPELFHKAVRIGELTVLELLLDAGAEINIVYESKTPLMNAGRLDVMKYLLEKGADVNVKVNTTALINALSCKYSENIKGNFKATLSNIEISEKLKEIINLLLKFGANLEGTDDTGSTALINSVDVLCHKNIMQFLLEKGSNVNQQNSKGQSALYRAAELSDLDKINILVNYGADVNQQCCEGLTPLHVAVQSLDIMTVFLKHQANINVQDRNGNTPLLLASKMDDYNAVNIVSFLIESGANVNQINNEGMTALMMAAQKCNESTMIVLLNCKAEVNVVAMGCPKPKSALSILLNKWLPGRSSRCMALKLIEEGATAAYVRPDALHRIIAVGNNKLVQKLIISGLCPIDIVLDDELIEWPIKTVSPLSVCLIKDNLQLAKSFMKNWYLTKSDIKVLSRNETILEKVNSTTRQYLEKVSTEPLRLELLSFISVSTAIGSGSDREEKINKSQLPTVLQEYLLFRKVAKEECIEEDADGDDEDDNDLNVLFLHELTFQQGIEDDDSVYYENDNSFYDHQFMLDDSSDESFLGIEDSDIESNLGDYDEDSESTLGDYDEDSESTLEDYDVESQSPLGDSGAES